MHNMNFKELPTPAALLDEARMHANITRMQERISALGVRLRPHVKTAKCLPVAQQQLAAGAVGITVSTLKEAEAFPKVPKLLLFSYLCLMNMLLSLFDVLFL